MLKEVLWRKIARVVMLLARELKTTPEQALNILYNSRTGYYLANQMYDTHLMSDAYILEDFRIELADTTLEKFPINDRFADIQVLRYHVDGFENLPLRRKKLIFFLSEAALWGRDILWHQNDEGNLAVRRLLECIYLFQRRNKTLDTRLETYTKRVWFANGVHHHYSNDKFRPDFTVEELRAWALQVPEDEFVKYVGCVAADAIATTEALIFDPTFHPKKVCLDHGADLTKASSVNFYKGVSQREVEDFYKTKGQNALNSQVVRAENGELEERVWKTDGMYGKAIAKICMWLGHAAKVADSPEQEAVIRQLIKYYESGNLADFDQFNIMWVAQRNSSVDFINGFIEVYSDPLGLKGTWESIVELVDEEASQRISTIAAEAQWFENHSPIAPEFRKKEVRGVSMNVVQAAMLGGDCYPATPIGVNLPNAEWIREQHGSKSISLNNITRAHHAAAKGSGVLDEFAANADEVARTRKYGSLPDDLHTQLHECLGHGSGQMLPGVSLDDLKAYGSTIEEARADLFALYFMADDHIIELGLLHDKEAAWSHYDAYLRSGLLVQLARIEEGKSIEESHMRNRHLISAWVLERAAPMGAAKMFVRGGKHYVEISDYEALRQLFGELLGEVQRIKSTGDYEAARNLIETYGVRIDPTLHAEVRSRYAALRVPPFSGFVNPVVNPHYDKDFEIYDVKLSYYEPFDEQMLRYSRMYSAL